WQALKACPSPAPSPDLHVPLWLPRRGPLSPMATLLDSVGYLEGLARKCRPFPVLGGLLIQATRVSKWPGYPVANWTVFPGQSDIHPAPTRPTAAAISRCVRRGIGEGHTEPSAREYERSGESQLDFFPDGQHVLCTPFAPTPGLLQQEPSVDKSSIVSGQAVPMHTGCLRYGSVRTFDAKRLQVHSVAKQCGVMARRQVLATKMPLHGRHPVPDGR